MIQQHQLVLEDAPLLPAARTQLKQPTEGRTMPMNPYDLMAFAILGSMKKAERKRAEEATFLTLVPGPPATRAALASLAVGNQARDSLRREKKVAAAMIEAVAAIAGGQPPAVVLLNSPLLCDLDSEEIQEDTKAMWAQYGTPRFGIELPREGDLWDRP